MLSRSGHAVQRVELEPDPNGVGNLAPDFKIKTRRLNLEDLTILKSYNN